MDSDTDSLRGLLGAAIPTPEPDPLFRRAVMSRVRAARDEMELRRARGRASRRFVPTTGLAAAALVFAASTAWIWLDSQVNRAPVAIETRQLLVEPEFEEPPLKPFSYVEVIDRSKDVLSF